MAASSDYSRRFENEVCSRLSAIETTLKNAESNRDYDTNRIRQTCERLEEVEKKVDKAVITEKAVKEYSKRIANAIRLMAAVAAVLVAVMGMMLAGCGG